MISGELWELHDDATIRKIDAAAVRLLTRGGARIEHGGLLDRLEGAGCRIDRSASRCYFTEKLIRDTVAALGRANATQVSIPAGWEPRLRLNHGGSHPHLLDWPSGQRRLATRQDIIDMAKMAQALDEIVRVGRVLTCAQVDPRIEPLWTTLTIAQHTSKPLGDGEIFFPGYIEPLVRMGEVISGKPNDPFLVASCDFFIAPLIMDPSQAACFLEKRKYKLTNVPGTMPVAGMSAPITIAGTVAVCVAELLAGWVLGYLVDPTLPAGGIVASGSLDMRTMNACFGSPEALLQNAATVNICRRLYGVPVWAAVGYCDCKRPGLEAAFAKMQGILGTPLGTAMLPGGDGLLSAGQDYSPVQHLLDLEMSKAVERFWGHFQVNDDTLAVELTEQLMGRPTTNFLDTDHTMAHYRAEQHYPRWFDRTPWQTPEYETQAEHKMLQRISDHCQDAIRRYERPRLDQSRLRELERIYAAAERTLLG